MMMTRSRAKAASKFKTLNNMFDSMEEEDPTIYPSQDVLGKRRRNSCELSEMKNFKIKREYYTDD
jgi:hypothetical protein